MHVQVSPESTLLGIARQNTKYGSRPKHTSPTDTVGHLLLDCGVLGCRWAIIKKLEGRKTVMSRAIVMGREGEPDINKNPARLRGMLCYSSEIITGYVSSTWILQAC